MEKLKYFKEFIYEKDISNNLSIVDMLSYLKIDINVIQKKSEKDITNIIKKAFQKKILLLHPDKGGNEEKAKECIAIYNTLISNIKLIKKNNNELIYVEPTKNKVQTIIITVRIRGGNFYNNVKIIKNYFKNKHGISIIGPNITNSGQHAYTNNTDKNFFIYPFDLSYVENVVKKTNLFFEQQEMLHIASYELRWVYSEKSLNI